MDLVRIGGPSSLPSDYCYRAYPVVLRRRVNFSCKAGRSADTPDDFKDIEIPKVQKKKAGDPLLDRSDYIWKMSLKNTGIDSRPIKQEEREKNNESGNSGFLSLTRAISLESMEVDLSKELVKASEATMEVQVAVARDSVSGSKKEEDSNVNVKWRYAPTQKEEKTWAKAKKFVAGGSEKLLEDVQQGLSKKSTSEDRLTSLQKFEQLKVDLQLFTLGIGLACTASTYFMYSPEVCFSYGVGLTGSLVYVRMLSSSVDALGAESMGSAAKGALNQPRLLVPVVLVMAFNRWNMLLVPQFDVVPLQLIPILVGFFTYKAATFVQAFREILQPLLPGDRTNES